MAPVLALLALAPWTAECVWGGFTVVDWPFVVVILAPMYGGAAVGIREIARRTGGGWPAIVLLAAAFGFVQAGLVDQSLFNPAFLDDTQFASDAAAARATWVPGLDFSAQQAFAYVGGHVALSICAPIAIVETFGRRTPWLGRRGLAVIAVLYVLGSLLIFRDSYENGHFLPSSAQLLFTMVVVIALVAAALIRRRPHIVRRRPPTESAAQMPTESTGRHLETGGWMPHPLIVAVIAALPHLSGDLAQGWAGLAIQVAVTGLVAVAVVRWSRRDTWGRAHVLAGWGAGLVVSAAIAYLVPTYAVSTPAMALLSDVCISLVTAALLGVTWKRQALNASTRAAESPYGE
ncbi:hypothetical protein JIG36_03600 [Actinoplanes sp. LDG1-06]|uniref:Uncharacterized protein n=1 Tax=Paractinoplanes ovalisporus TaxID=2810368 RepID=A0ABS2A459_9ACTN|nr:hypothetical protein [Actinoplanes ovalisporus]MBM2614639.1 hypothetical protein [Actinoplanes ovalisporus]